MTSLDVALITLSAASGNASSKVCMNSASKGAMMTTLAAASAAKQVVH